MDMAVRQSVDFTVRQSVDLQSFPRQSIQLGRPPIPNNFAKHSRPFTLSTRPSLPLLSLGFRRHSTIAVDIPPEHTPITPPPRYSLDAVKLTRPSIDVERSNDSKGGPIEPKKATLESKVAPTELSNTTKETKEKGKGKMGRWLDAVKKRKSMSALEKVMEE
ncbi:hypothetical protein HDV00_002912 [Rhizophlyctis rosea]|nr:hypothetical protein HDV00_002912 [Rhizophlyctis rosea]